MPSFSSHWATCSGSIEKNETPLECAQRELSEETNLAEIDNVELKARGGLYLDVDVSTSRKIRVYPFTAYMPPNVKLELRGTEHDEFKWIPLSELSSLEPSVPKLYEAFHHATYGQFLSNIENHSEIQEWAKDRVNGAAHLAKQAVELAGRHPHSANWIKILRPSMVPIVNAVQHFTEKFDHEHKIHQENKNLINKMNKSPNTTYKMVANEIIKDMDNEFKRCVEIGVNALVSLLSEYASVNNGSTHPFVIGTFSRSSTLKAIFTLFLQQVPSNINIHIICAKSTPGDEGVLMANDILSTTTKKKNVSCSCIEDKDFFHQISTPRESIQVIIVGSDCIIPNKFIVNKIGTKLLTECANEGGVPVFCCSDRWKIWNDDFPPPLENIFELIPYDSFTKVLLCDE